MAGKRDAAWVADILVAQLKADLPAKLTSLETEYGDSVQLEDIPAANYVISERQQIPGFPLIAVVPDTTDMVPFTGETYYNIEYHTITIAVVRTANEGEDTLTRQTLRTVRAVEEVFLDDRTCGASVDDVLVMSKAYAPLLAGPDAMLKEGQVTVRVQTST